MGDVSVKRSGYRLIVVAVVCAGFLIGLGLALGLGLGLRSRKDNIASPLKVTASSSSSASTTSPTPPDHHRTSKSGDYRFAAVASDAKICSDIGTDVLAVQHGSAVDAAIATMVCIGVVHRHSCGIGGGLFMTIYNRSSKSVYVLDARERAPLATNESFFVGRSKDASTFGGLAIAVPGDIMGHWEVHRKFGRVPWHSLILPSVRLCREGVPILRPIHGAISQYRHLLKNMSYSMYFHPETGEIVKIGDKVRYPVLARTLEIIAAEGAPAFYNGSLTSDIVSDIQDHGGIITSEDLNQYTATWRTPLSLTLRDNLTIHSMPPPASGVVFQYIMNILEGYEFTPNDLSTIDKQVLTHHRIIEAMKFAYAKRTDLGDEDYVDMRELIVNMTSRDYAEHIRSLITDNQTHDTEYYGPTFYDKLKTGTSHSSIVDAEGNAVTTTATINTFFGSKVRGSRSGIIFNNIMDDFSTPGLINFYGVPASEANFIQPRKRPLSSMCPSVIVNQTSGDVVLAVGASGGTRITTAVSLVSLYTLRLGLSVLEAVDYRRIHHQLLPKSVSIERGFSESVIEGLRAKGHLIRMSGEDCVVNPIRVVNDMRHAVSDARKGGQPDGY